MQALLVFHVRVAVQQQRRVLLLRQVLLVQRCCNQRDKHFRYRYRCNNNDLAGRR